MRRKFYLCLILILCVKVAKSDTLDSLLLVLDKNITSCKIYSDKKDIRIRTLKEKLHLNQLSNETTYHLQESLYKEYKSYICDSAIFYLNKNIELAQQINDSYKLNESIIKLSYLLSSSGMYMEAIDVLKMVNKSSLSKEQLMNYFIAYDHVYGELGYYTQNHKIGTHYTLRSKMYKDSIYQIASPDSEIYLSMEETRLRDEGKLQEALAINDKRLSQVTINSPEYAALMYYRALIFREQKEQDNYIRCLSLSSIADIRSAIKDHASLWMLAQALLDRGDLERAYQYMNFSWTESKFYNARLRAWQSADDLSLIDDTYQLMLRQRNSELKIYILIVSLLSLLLFIALCYIYRQVKHLRTARQNLLKVNTQLENLNKELQKINFSLQTANKDLAESNQIKEVYIARFIKLCSTYVDHLDTYRRMVHKKVLTNQITELLHLTRSNSILEEALNELYENFDSAFLNLFPNFIEQFNSLLQENEQIRPKKNNTLNTELRIFALIRLGITDSSQIAEFLHYSVNTIYNYRAKVKNKARISRKDFEEVIANIR
ncbi:DUF6377 domain-containing protein [Phocaeicola coprocola]|uniref:DUF6377 domain-containing protein n=1 Tax=Phocaeicola coprocola TaxID=310298 RepID=UPI00267514EC|nr:DUF6377 domain-containing protein [Phocaeicola coprocola]